MELIDTGFLQNGQVKIDSKKDHRIAMSFAVMGMNMGIDLKIMNPEFIKTSFPNFIESLNFIGGNLTE